MYAFASCSHTVYIREHMSMHVHMLIYCKAILYNKYANVCMCIIFGTWILFIVCRIRVEFASALTSETEISEEILLFFQGAHVWRKDDEVCCTFY